MTLGSIALISLITFVIVQFSKPNPLINLGILRNRNFGLSSISSLGMGVGLYGSIYPLPLYLAQIQNYNALQIGEVIMWMSWHRPAGNLAGRPNQDLLRLPA